MADMNTVENLSEQDGQNHISECDNNDLNQQEHNFRVEYEDDIEVSERDSLSEMSVDFYKTELELPESPSLVRSNTQYLINGIVIYNGNPNGSRFYDDDNQRASEHKKFLEALNKNKK